MTDKLLTNVNVKVNYLDQASISIQNNITTLMEKIDNIKCKCDNLTTNGCKKLSREFINSYTTYYETTLPFTKNVLKQATITTEPESISDISINIDGFYTVGNAFILRSKDTNNKNYYFISVPGYNNNYNRLYYLNYCVDKTKYDLGNNFVAYDDKANGAIDIIFMNSINNLIGFFIIRIDTTTKEDINTNIYCIHKEYNNIMSYTYSDGIFYEFKQVNSSKIGILENMVVNEYHENTKQQNNYLILTPFIASGEGNLSNIKFIDINTATQNTTIIDSIITKRYPLCNATIFLANNAYYYMKATSHNEVIKPIVITPPTKSSTQIAISTFIDNYYWFTDTDGSIKHIFVKPPTNSDTTATLYYLDINLSTITSTAAFVELKTIELLKTISNASSNFYVCSNEWQFNNNLMITNNGNVQQWDNLKYMIGYTSSSIAHYCNSPNCDHFFAITSNTDDYDKLYIINIVYPFNYVFSVI